MKSTEVEVAGKTGIRRLDVFEGLDLGPEADVCLVRIPADFYEMLRATDVADERIRRIPLDWRLGSRTAFQTLFGRGLRIFDFLTSGENPRRNYYVLKRVRTGR